MTDTNLQMKKFSSDQSQYKNVLALQPYQEIDVNNKHKHNQPIQFEIDNQNDASEFPTQQKDKKEKQCVDTKNQNIFIVIILIVILFAAYFQIMNRPEKPKLKKIIKKPTALNPFLTTATYLQDLNFTDVLVTSSQKKFGQKIFNKQHIQNDLKNGKYKKLSKFKSQSTTYDSQQLSLGQIGRRSVSRLQSSDSSNFINQILIYPPYLDLPFCLFVKQNSVTQEQKKIDAQIAKSVFMLNYTNYISIFYSETQQIGLKSEQLENISKQILKVSYPKINNMFYKVNSNETNYYTYRYFMREFCVHKSFVFFVNNVLKTDALYTLNRYHQLFPVYLTFIETNDFYLVNSFAMRVFDLVDLNDYNGTNAQYLSRANSEAFFSTIIIQLCKRNTKKFSLSEIYQPISPPISNSKWVTAILKSDNKIYRNQDYLPIFSLSQTYNIYNIEKVKKIFKQLQSGSSSSRPNENTQLTTYQIVDSLNIQQTLFLPFQYSVGKRQYRKLYAFYGPDPQQLRSPFVIQERPICVTFLAMDQSKMQAQNKIRMLTSLKSILKQNYTNFKVYLYDSNLSQQVVQQISQLLKQQQFPQNRYFYFKNYVQKPPIFNIIKSAFQNCEESELQIVVDSDFEIIGPNYFNLINIIKNHIKDAWIIHTNYKTDQFDSGTPYRIFKDDEYRDFTSRTKNLNFLSLLSAWQVKLIRSIPLNYHLNKKQQWMEGYWHKALMHSLTQLATVHHIQYTPEIGFEVSSNHFKKYYNYHNITNQDIQYIESMPILMPLGDLTLEYQKFQKLIRQKIKHDQ